MKKVLLFTFSLVWVSSCLAQLATASLSINNHSFVVEIADTNESRAKGLMHRKTMASNKGMLFVFETDQMLSFWMKNTPLPLTIAYIDKDGVIRDILDMTPHSLASIKSSVPVRYALELNQGVFEKLEIKIGDKVEGLAP